MGHVNHTLFLAYFEQARAEIWSANGLVLHGKGEAHSAVIKPILKSLTAEFKAPLTFPDVVTIGVRTVELSQREYDQFYACVSHASGRVVATGTARFVNFVYDAGRPSEMSDSMRRTLFGSRARQEEQKEPATRETSRPVKGAAKEKLVALGGTVMTERVGGGTDEGIFRCVAELGGQRLSATSAAGDDEAALEHRVAKQLLDSVFAEL
jgi:acyl-CoA thioester hydrolase